MNSPFTINATENLPTADGLRSLLGSFRDIAIEYNSLPSDYVRSLTYSLPEYSVYNREWDKKIFIRPSIHNDKIIEKKAEIFECARLFRQDANRLMALMATTFGIDLNTLDGLHELKFKKSRRQGGKLNVDWRYQFHGAECRFEHAVTAQVVEVIIVTKPEFGYLDSYFFCEYMTSTERFKQLAVYFSNDHNQIAKALDFLVLEGTLSKTRNLGIYRNIIAL